MFTITKNDVTTTIRGPITSADRENAKKSFANRVIQSLPTDPTAEDALRHAFAACGAKITFKPA